MKLIWLLPLLLFGGLVQSQISISTSIGNGTNTFYYSPWSEMIFLVNATGFQIWATGGFIYCQEQFLDTSIECVGVYDKRNMILLGLSNQTVLVYNYLNQLVFSRIALSYSPYDSSQSSDWILYYSSRGVKLVLPRWIYAHKGTI